MREHSSRLSRTTKEKTKKQIIFFAVAIIVLVFVVTQFGPGVLDRISSFMSGFGKPPTETRSSDKNSLEVPFINSIPEVTDSAAIKITGSSTYSDAQVELFVNRSLYDTQPLTDNQKFAFENVSLSEGSNIIKARVKKGNISSDFTRDYTVIISKGNPKLEMSNPTDGQEFTRGDQTINVQGKTDPDNTVTVNNFRAIVDSAGNFSYFLKLTDGDNDVKIIAQNTAGKQTEKTIKVKYKP